MSNLWLDTETYSETPIKHGVGAYIHGNAQVMLISYALDDEPVKVWDLTAMSPMPRDLFRALCDPAITITAHNAWFDRTLMAHCFPAPCYSWDIRRWRCTMAQAYAHGLPGGLDALGQILGLEEDQQKREGKQLIQLFCKPRPKNSELRRATRRTHPHEWAQFVAYAGQDTETMREIARRLPTWNYPDNPECLQSWFRDQRINDRGVLLDLEFAEAAVRATTKAKRKLAKATKESTDGYVEAATQRDKLLAYLLLEYNVELPNMKADTLERRLEDPELPEYVKDLIRLRLQSSKTSQTKYKRALNAVSPDGRARGMLQWCGAARTGRWAGRILQPQNFPRPKLEQHVIEMGIRAIKLGCEDLICA